MDIIILILSGAGFFALGYFKGKYDAHTYWTNVFKRDIEAMQQDADLDAALAEKN